MVPVIRPERVLIISQDAVFAMDLEEMLGEHGIKVDSFQEFDEAAVSAVRGAEFMSAIVDVDFYRHGSRLCVHQKTWPDVPVVVLGPGAEETRHHAFARDVHCVSKPVSVDQLLPLLVPGAERLRRVS